MKNLYAVRRQFVGSFLLCISLVSLPPAFAHGGEDHGDASIPVQASQLLATRAEAKSDEVELLAVYEDKKLIVYLSRFNTNEPIDNAQVDIESGTKNTSAKADGNGRYTADAPWLAAPGKHAMVVTIQGKTIADLLEITLTIPEAAKAAHGNRIANIAVWLAALGSAVVLAWLVFLAQRRKQSKS